MSSFTEDTPTYRITPSEAFGAMVIAGIFDMLSIIPFINFFSSIFCWIFLGLYFRQFGVSVASKRLIFLPPLTTLSEIIPIWGSFAPSLMFGAGLIIYLSRQEDKKQHREEVQKNTGVVGV